MKTSTETMQEVVGRDLMARPWLVAPEGSIWLASGDYGHGRGAFTDCLISALPEHVTGGPVLFAPLPPLSLLDQAPIDPQRITRATRLLLVHADDPGQPFDPDDQPYLDGASE